MISLFIARPASTLTAEDQAIPVPTSPQLATAGQVTA
jgi:hypothetical protein